MYIYTHNAISMCANNPVFLINTDPYFHTCIGILPLRIHIQLQRNCRKISNKCTDNNNMHSNSDKNLYVVAAATTTFSK